MKSSTAPPTSAPNTFPRSSAASAPISTCASRPSPRSMRCLPTLLALTCLVGGPAAAQHEHHDASPTPPVADAAPADRYEHLTIATPMRGALGAYAVDREASGTAWQPDASVHSGVHREIGK